jgi:hypothetical protein
MSVGRADQCPSGEFTIANPLTAKENRLVSTALRDGLDKNNEEHTAAVPPLVKSENPFTLRPGIWLDDAIINGFFKLLAARGRRMSNRCHVFPSYFTTGLMNIGHRVNPGKYEYANVENWSKLR